MRIDGEDGGRRIVSRDHEGRFREPIGRAESRSVKPLCSEAGGEAIERRRPDRLGPVDSTGPRTQIEIRRLLPRDGARAQCIAEIGPARVGHPEPAYHLEPGHGSLYEARRLHQECLATGIERRQDAVDQAHVVRHRQPGERQIIRAEPEDRGDTLDVMEQVGVRDDDAARRPGRPGTVLQERHPARGIAQSRAIGRPVEIVDEENGRQSDIVRCGISQRSPGCQHHGGLRLADDPGDPPRAP